MQFFSQWYEQQETANLQQWISGSVIQEPVYHGTNARFKEFQKMPTKRFILFTAYDVAAQGFFFSESREDAEGYGKTVITAYLRLKNPLLDPRRDKHLAIDRLPSKKEAQLAFILRHMIGKDSYYGKYIDIGVRRDPVDDDFARRRDYQWIYSAMGTGGLHWDVLDKPEVVSSMRRLGYDGTFVEEKEDRSGRSIFVMDASQIYIADIR